jgi:hypothetical protein
MKKDEHLNLIVVLSQFSKENMKSCSLFSKLNSLKINVVMVFS